MIETEPHATHGKVVAFYALQFDVFTQFIWNRNVGLMLAIQSCK